MKTTFVYQDESGFSCFSGKNTCKTIKNMTKTRSQTEKMLFGEPVFLLARVEQVKILLKIWCTFGVSLLCKNSPKRFPLMDFNLKNKVIKMLKVTKELR